MIIPVCRKNICCDPENCRPINRTLIVSRNVKRLITNGLIAYLRKHELITTAERGFLREKSWATSMTDCVNDKTGALSAGMSAMAIFLDITKALF